MPCRINKGRKWSGRIMLEHLHHYTYNHQKSYFLTLTYNDDTVPTTAECVQTLAKKPFLTWLHSQRKMLGGFRYYAVGEYGDLTKRPHYHLALFPLDDEQATLLCRRWAKRFGFTSISEMGDEKARYLANYTTKKLTKNTDGRLENGQEPEFRTSSRNPPIGAGFIDVLVQTYSTGKGADIVRERGDIERVFRIGKRLYPIAPWILDKARERLGIPLLEMDRSLHPNYWEFHMQQEALWDPEAAHSMEVHLNAQKIQKLYRNTTPNL